MKNKKGFLQGALTGALAVLLVFGLVACTGKLNSGNEEGVITSDTEDKLEEIKALIDSDYLDEVDDDALQEGVLEGYIAGLGDPYAAYYDAEATEKLTESTNGTYDGIGAVLTQMKDTGVITLTQIYEGSPAEAAGLKDNDILYKVAGEEVTGVDLSEVVTNIKGEKGTGVEIVVLRGSDAKEIETTVIRDTIEYPTVEYEMMDDNIGYIRITEFDLVTFDQYKEALDDLEAQNMAGLVVDLRSNPGGNLSTVCNILDLMLPEGLIVYTEDKNGERQVARSDADNQFTKPMTVLVNGYSASASEIYAGAIQDYGLGQIVGETTYGKGVVQQVFDLKDGTKVKFTISEYFTPNGRNIDGEGITPDVEVIYEADEENPDADNQLEKAVEILKESM